MRTSLHTALRAGSIVSPARRTDTPVICGQDEHNGLAGSLRENWSWREARERGKEERSQSHPSALVTPALVLLTLWGLNDTRLRGKTQTAPS